MRKIFLFLFAAVLSITTAYARTITAQNADCSVMGGGLTMSAEDVLYVESGANAEAFDLDNVPATYEVYCTLLDGSWEGGLCENATVAYDGTTLTLSGTFTTEDSQEVIDFTISGELLPASEEGPEFWVVEDQITNFVFDMDSWPMVCSGGPSTNYQVEAYLVLTEDADGTLSNEDCSVSVRGQDVTLISGTLSNLDPYAPSADAVLRVQMGEEYYEFHLAMSATATVYDVTVTETALSMQTGALKMTGVWLNEADGLEYPFVADIGGWDYSKAEDELIANVTVGGWGEDEPWIGFGESTMTLTNEEGFLTLTGEIQTNSGPILNVTAYGMAMIMEMDVEAQLTEMEIEGVNYLNLNGTDKNSAMGVDLYLDNYTGQDKTYSLNEASTVAGGISVYGDITKEGDTFTGVAYAETGDALYVLPMTLAELVIEYTNIAVTNTTGTAEARYMGWGSEYYLALSLEGTWSDGTETYPVLLEITDGYDPTTTSGTAAVSLTIGGWEDTDPWLGNAEGEMSYTLSGQDITLKGKIESPWMGIYWDVTLTGTILPNYTRAVTSGNFGTICLPYGGVVKGATLWELAKAETDQVLLVSANKLEAGVPYIFEATATQIAVYCDATVADEAGVSNGLHGTFDNNTVVASGDYIVYDNALCPSDGTAMVNANRAYIVMSEVPTSHTPMPGRRYIGMSVQGENAATAVDNITTGAEVVKAIENGQLIIIRGGEKFNAQGQKL